MNAHELEIPDLVFRAYAEYQRACGRTMGMEVSDSDSAQDGNAGPVGNTGPDCTCLHAHAHEDACPGSEPAAAPDAGNRVDHDRGAEPPTADPAEACGQDVPNRDAKRDGIDERMRTPAGGRVHRPSGEGLSGYSLNAGLETWGRA